MISWATASIFLCLFGQHEDWHGEEVQHFAVILWQFDFFACNDFSLSSGIIFSTTFCKVKLSHVGLAHTVKNTMHQLHLLWCKVSCSSGVETIHMPIAKFCTWHGHYNRRSCCNDKQCIICDLRLGCPPICILQIASGFLLLVENTSFYTPKSTSLLNTLFRG